MNAVRLAGLFAAAALACGAVFAQDVPVADAGGVCRSFCDADATKCRKAAAYDAATSVDPLLDFRGPRADKDDFSVEKHDQAVRSADRDRFNLSQRCSDTRLACRQRCAPAPVAASSAH